MGTKWDARTRRRGTIGIAALLATTALCNIGAAQPVSAQEAASGAVSETDAQVQFDIAPQSLSEALIAFSRQSGLEVSADARAIADKRSPGVRGVMSREQALTALLADSGLSFSISGRMTTIADQPDDGAMQLGPVRVQSEATASAGYQGAPDAVYGTPGSVSVMSREAIRNSPVRDTRDLMTSLAGVYSGEGNGSFPTVSPNIRGLQDSGRVIVAIDGARQNAQRGFGSGSSGYQSNSGQAYVDPAFIREVEVNRNPGATSGTAGSLGGSVNFRTIGADDLIADGRRWGGELSATSGDNQYDFRGSALAAFRLPNAPLAITLGASRLLLDEYTVGQRGGEIASSGNFKGRDAWSSLLKFETDFGDVDASLSWMHQDNAFRYGSDTFTNREIARVDSLALQFAWDPSSAFIDLNASLWYNDSDTLETREARILDDVLIAPDTHIDLGLESFGFALENASRFETSAGALTLSYGVEGFRDDASANATSDTIAANPDWESRYIAFSPPGQRDVAGGFINAEWRPSDWIAVSGGLRYDWHRLSGAPTYYDHVVVEQTTVVPCDPISNHYTATEYYNDVFLPQNSFNPFWATPAGSNLFFTVVWPSNISSSCQPGTGIDETTYTNTYPPHTLDIDRTDAAWLPTLTLEFHPTPWLSPFVSYSESFRPPTVLEAFFVGGPPAEGVGFNYAPNVHLRPERARTFELGANIVLDNAFRAGDHLRFKAVAFDRTVKDYVVLGTILTEEVADATYLSFVNLDGDTTMRGVELEGHYDAGRFWIGGQMSALETEWPQTTDIFSNSTITTDGEIFATPGNVPPKFTATLDFGARFFDERFELGARVNHVTPTLSRFLDSDGELTERSEEYTLVDLYSAIDLHEAATLRLAVTNATDVNYIPATGAFNGPGRTYMATLSVRY